MKNFTQMLFGAAMLCTASLTANAMEYVDVELAWSNPDLTQSLAEIKKYDANVSSTQYETQWKAADAEGTAMNGTPYISFVPPFDVPLTHNGQTVTNVAFKSDWNSSWTKVVLFLYFEDAVTEAGDYYLEVPQGKIVDDSDNPTIGNKAFKLKLTVGEGDPAGIEPASIIPGNGATWDYVEKAGGFNLFALKFNSAMTVIDASAPYLQAEDGSKTPCQNMFGLASFGEPKQVNIRFDTSVTDKLKSGVYTLVVPAGCLKDAEGNLNGYFESNYIYKQDPQLSSGDKPVTDEVVLETATVTEPGGTVYNLLDPETKIKVMAEAGTLKVTTNVDEEAVQIAIKMLDITDVENEQSSWSSADAIFMRSIPKDNGVFEWKDMYVTVGQAGIKFYEGHKYVLEVVAYSMYMQPNVNTPIGSPVYGAVIEGTYPAYRYSDVKVVSITPEPGSDFSTDDVMVVEFSAPVTLINTGNNCGFSHGSAGFAPMQSIESSNDGKTWTITFPADEITGTDAPDGLQPHIAGVDANGLRIYPVDQYTTSGNPFVGGYEASCYFGVKYSSGSVTGNEVTVTPQSGSTVTSLSELSFTGTTVSEINPSFATGVVPELKNAEGETVAKLESGDYEENGGKIKREMQGGTYGTCVKVTIPLSTTITTQGTYTMTIPAGFFNLGRELSSKSSKRINYVITVSDRTGIDNAVAETYSVALDGEGVSVEGVNAGDLVEVYSLTGIKLGSAVAGGSSVNVACNANMVIVTVNGTSAVKVAR